MAPLTQQAAAAAAVSLRADSKADTTPKPETAPKRQARTEARAGMALSLATFAMAVASAGQAVLYLQAYGANGRTDGFFVAFALYTTFGVFSQSMRLTAAPMLVEPGARLTPYELMRALAVIALPVLLLTGPLAGPLAHVLAPGLDSADRAVTQDALPVLGAAVALHLFAAGWATVLAVRDRFYVIAAAYAVGAGAGLISYPLLSPVAHELTLGWSMLVMAITTTAIMGWGVLRSGGFGARTERRGLRHAGGDAALLLGRTVIYLAFNVLLLVTLAFASHGSSGDTTVLSYGYLFASYLVAGTAMALGMSRIPEMTRLARREQRSEVRATVPVGFRYAMLLVAPAMCGLVAAGASIIGAVFPSSFDAGAVLSLRTFGALLVPWVVAALLVNLLLPMMFASGRARMVNLLALPLAAIHILATFALDAVWGVNGAVAAFAIAPVLFAIVLIVAGTGEWAAGLAKELVGDAIRFVGAAAIAFGAGSALGAAVADGLPQALIAAAVGGVLYAALLAVVARQQVDVVLRAVRPAST